MELAGNEIVLVVAAFALIAVLAGIVSLKRRRREDAMDYAEQIVLRRYPAGQVVGARLAKRMGMWNWVLDVRDGEAIYRLWLDARTLSVIGSTDPRNFQRRGSGAVSMSGIGMV